MNALAGWNTDIKSAPHGRYVVKQRKEGVDQRIFVPERVILTTKCGKVTLSHYLPEEKRWLMLGKGEAPDAWMPWPDPYSVSARGTNSAVESAGSTILLPVEPAANSLSTPTPSHPDSDTAGAGASAPDVPIITMKHEGIQA